MGATIESPFELSRTLVGLVRSGQVDLIKTSGPHPDIEGYLVGVAHMTKPPPHGGERHDDGDEPLLLLRGAVDVLLDEGSERERVVELHAGQGFVVPRGIWHRLIVHEPCTLVFVTPGPNNNYRPRRRSAGVR